MKQISSRQFQKGFGKLNAALKPGQTVQVTKHHKAIGQFTKAPVPRRRRLPNLLANLEQLGYSAAEGDQMLAKVHDRL